MKDKRLKILDKNIQFLRSEIEHCHDETLIRRYLNMFERFVKRRMEVILTKQ